MEKERQYFLCCKAVVTLPQVGEGLGGGGL